MNPEADATHDDRRMASFIFIMKYAVAIFTIFIGLIQIVSWLITKPIAMNEGRSYAGFPSLLITNLVIFAAICFLIFWLIR